MPPQLEKNNVVPTSWQDEGLARHSVSREVPCSALKGETVPDSLPATPKFNDTPGSHEGNTGGPVTTSSEPLLPSGSRQERRFPCVVWKGFPAFQAHLRMRPASRGNSRRATWVVPHAERPRFPGPLLRRTRGPDPSSKATLWVKAQHEGALPPPCIVRRGPRVPHTARRGT